MFFFIATMKVLAQIVANLLVVAYLQDIRVYAHSFISLTVPLEVLICSLNDKLVRKA